MSYGSLFSSKMIAEGRFDEAFDTATHEIEAQPTDPETYFNRAQALAGLERFEEAVADYERSLALDPIESGLDPEIVDDELFFALRSLATARSKTDRAAAIETIERYREILPEGRHLDDIAKWIDSFNGVETVWYREKV
jgi:tetratricopeptide (TPR) repeat protein